MTPSQGARLERKRQGRLEVRGTLRQTPQDDDRVCSYLRWAYRLCERCQTLHQTKVNSTLPIHSARTEQNQKHVSLGKIRTIPCCNGSYKLCWYGTGRPTMFVQGKSGSQSYWEDYKIFDLVSLHDFYSIKMMEERIQSLKDTLMFSTAGANCNFGRQNRWHRSRQNSYVCKSWAF